MNANQAEATKHQSKSIIHALPTAGLTPNGVYGDFFGGGINLQYIWKTNSNIRLLQQYKIHFKSLYSSQRWAAAIYMCELQRWPANESLQAITKTLLAPAELTL